MNVELRPEAAATGDDQVLAVWIDERALGRVIIRTGRLLPTLTLSLDQYGRRTRADV